MKLWPEPFSPKTGLYLVATPIGNLRDMTLRALDVLSAADMILCEDKRVSTKLLNAYGIKKPLRPYHDHSTAADREAVLAMLKEGKVLALISDAGTPMIADPGYKLVKACREASLPVYAIPGASAVLNALQLSAMPTDIFTFQGFLPTKSGALNALLATIKNKTETHVFFESANRLTKTLGFMKDVLGDRKIVIARELTKKFEEVFSGTADEILTHYETHILKGEIVIVIEGKSDEVIGEDALDDLLRKALSANSLKEAVELVRMQTALAKKVVYNRALALKDAADK
ncbi:MAG: 16S rRNA (cytidine(1402)-2'-O)-methyltransferase [Micavibrio sp.]|nr:16S rRNA (cytidine(1402)-2'-O)-methyltransferase [Micavibrio sp.]